MKFSISTSILMTMLNKIQYVINQRPVLPILSNFLIQASHDEIILTATDLTVSILCQSEAHVLEEGTVTLPAKIFTSLVRELTTPNLEITSINHVVTIMAGTSRFRINGKSSVEFPTLPDLIQAQAIKVNQKKLKDLLYCTSFAVSKEDNRYALSGLFIQITNKKMTFLGTDGKRLARSHVYVDVDEGFSNQCTVPLKAVEEVMKNISDADEEVKILFLSDKIVFEFNQTRIISKLLMSEYPDISQVIPDQLNIFVTLHREELISLLKQVSLFTVDQYQSIRFSFIEGELQLVVNSTEIGEGQVSMPVNYFGPPLDIAFNPGYFVDILRHCKEETVTLGLIDKYNPGILLEGHQVGLVTENSPFFVIMPMRLSSEKSV